MLLGRNTQFIQEIRNMSCDCNCNCKCCTPNACCIAILLSIVVGVVVGLLFAFTSIPFIVTAVWIALGLSGLALIIVVVALFLSALSPDNAIASCLCKHMICLLVGIIGTLILAIILLAAPISPAVLTNIILVAIGAVFLSILIISLTSFLWCISRKVCCNICE